MHNQNEFLKIDQLLNKFKVNVLVCQDDPVNLVLLSSRCTHQASACAQCYTNSITQEIESKGTHRFAMSYA